MPPIDAEILARLQFAFTIAFHILFPTLTIGLGGFLVFFEAKFLRTGDEVWYRLYRFWVNIFALSFGMGVVSGIVLSYQLGTNWSEWSRITGPVLGPLIGFEVLTAFFLEAGFLGIMLFGWDKVGPRLHFLATCLVAVGTAISAFWILAANSWMQTPQGATFIDGHFVVDSWFEVIFNPSFPYRLMHMTIASYLTTAVVIAGISGFYLLRNQNAEIARPAFSTAFWALLVLAPLQIFLGDQHGLNTLEHQPMKVAAMEGNWETRSHAPFHIFAIPDRKAQTNHLELSIPWGSSLILKHSPSGVVPGLNEVPIEDQPPVGVVFWSFRIMLAIGFLFLALGLWGAWSRYRGNLFEDRWLQRFALVMTPAGFVATLAGWFVTEVGRQPWTVYGMVRTSESVSPTVTAEAVATTLVLFLIVYGGLFGAYLYYLVKLVRKGPNPLSVGEEGERPEAIRGARPGLVIPAE
ncbi:cytochrome ubiquinol oxidase subunit I [Parvibaculum sp.]|uniref:cytochrome ubiquinol oxidase subunit I n=1 Tax=Parvibaculum sp. TaxID=2024848 RepID=UPI0027304C0D|nr:cytochrome ubiquinol oxidase subunit I [Parvibaculum sp.]MDP1626657.1 cytochrome ubiquinol oxidase subunit I [Parvibaculum sp.]MDP2150578.1 cytochrome ubiquinol oxidase subunit I [Parvibaculum sp.]MDP3330046.1 cytochrome ubiquinol oxidase subunit I [Parvibaculum sp.]